MVVSKDASMTFGHAVRRTTILRRLYESRIGHLGHHSASETSGERGIIYRLSDMRNWQPRPATPATRVPRNP